MNVPDERGLKPVRLNLHARIIRVEGEMNVPDERGLKLEPIVMKADVNTFRPPAR